MTNTAGWHHKGLSVGGGNTDPEWAVPCGGCCFCLQPVLQLFVCAESRLKWRNGNSVRHACSLAVQDPLAWVRAATDCPAEYRVHAAVWRLNRDHPRCGRVGAHVGSVWATVDVRSRAGYAPKAYDHLYRKVSRWCPPELPFGHSDDNTIRKTYTRPFVSVVSLVRLIK